jgi:hypothetical protein
LRRPLDLVDRAAGASSAGTARPEARLIALLRDCPETLRRKRGEDPIEYLG